MAKKQRPKKHKNSHQTASADRRHRADLWILLLIAGLTVILYWPALEGDFIYDDTRQIIQNHFIKDSRYIGEAVTSDVWAFKGEQEEAWSSYWRPGFVLWLTLNYRLFGVESPFGWHLTSLLLHLTVLLLLYRIMPLLGGPRMLCAAILLLYAVHPAHVEDVAWISGVTDPLLSVFFLGAVLSMISHRKNPATWKYFMVLVLTTISMLSKEIGIVLPVVLFLIVVLIPEKSPTVFRDRLWEAFRVALPLVGMAVLYLVARWSVLGGLAKEQSWHYTWFEVILTAPSLLTFYLRQAVFPLWIGPSYPLRSVTPEVLSFLNFGIPVLVSLTALWLAYLVIRRGNTIQRLGLALFLFPLLPAFNIHIFFPEQLVHDRYLYLPLSGFLMMLIPALYSLRVQWKPGRKRNVEIALTGMAALLLAVQTFRYIPAWSTELNLWRASVEADPGSAFNWAQYGVYLNEAGENQAALDAFNKSLAIRAMPNALLGRVDVYLDTRQYQAAEKDLEVALTQNPDNPSIYERLAKVYQDTRRLQDAATLLAQARQRVPGRYCGFTTDLAIIMYISGRKQDAWRELESVLPRVSEELHPKCQVALFYAGNLQKEFGNVEQGNVLLQQYLSATARADDDFSRQFRDLARKAMVQ